MNSLSAWERVGVRDLAEEGQANICFLWSRLGERTK